MPLWFHGMANQRSSEEILMKGIVLQEQCARQNKCKD